MCTHNMYNIYVYIYMSIYLYKCVYTYVYTNIHTHVHVCIYIHTYIHTYIHMHTIPSLGYLEPIGIAPGAVYREAAEPASSARRHFLADSEGISS